MKLEHFLSRLEKVLTVSTLDAVQPIGPRTIKRDGVTWSVRCTCKITVFVFLNIMYAITTTKPCDFDSGHQGNEGTMMRMMRRMRMKMTIMMRRMRTTVTMEGGGGG